MIYCLEPCFDWAAKQAQCLLQACEISSLPVDPFKIIKWFGWEIFTVGYVSGCAQIPRNQVIDGVDSDLYCINGRYKIIYNEKAYPARIRFTLAHEIGHIWLKHLEDFELTRLSQNSFAEEQYDVLEKEANCFAAELLMPYFILRKLQPLSEEGLVNFCKVSRAAASNRLKTIKKKMGWSCSEVNKSVGWENNPSDSCFDRQFYPNIIAETIFVFETFSPHAKTALSSLPSSIRYPFKRGA
jgi:hypothetical protein